MAHADGSAGDADYTVIGDGYRPDRLVRAIDASAEALPFPDDSFDGALTTFSVHQWQDLSAGLQEMRRVTHGSVVIMTCDPERLDRFWLNDYAPEVIATEARRYPSIDRLIEGLGADVEVRPLPIPRGCVDGFSEAYFGRPEMFFDPGARKANSAWSFVPKDTADASIQALRESVSSGRWDAEHGDLRTAPHFDGSLVLIRATG